MDPEDVATEQARVSSDGLRENTARNGSISGGEEVSQPTIGGDTTEGLDNVLRSDIGVSTLLNRLKQSISSARDFAIFLKKRSAVEEEHAQGVRKLSRGTFELIRRPENRQGSFAQNYEDLTRIHDRMSDNGLQFATSLHQMSDDLEKLAGNMERGRKHWKQSGLNAEKRVQDSEAALDKAKSKYDSLAEQYDRARTGDRQTAGRFGIKGPKSAAQQEEDLYRKLQGADSDYAARVQATQSQRQELDTTLRPQAITALRELITECDSGLTLQLQKFASLNEQLLLRNGLSVSPLKNQTRGTTPESKSLREVAQQIDNDRDFRDYIMTFSNKAGSRPPEIKYEKHPALSSPRQSQAPQFPQQQNTNGPPPNFNNQMPSARTPSGGYEQGFRPAQPGQISGVTPYQSDNRDGLPMPGDQNQYRPGQQSQYYPVTNQYPPDQQPPGQQTLGQQHQLPSIPQHQYHQNQQNQYPHGSTQTHDQSYANSQAPQLPQLDQFSMSGANPSYRSGGTENGLMNNNLRPDTGRQGSGVVSPISPPLSSNPPSMSGGLPSAPMNNNYRSDLPTPGSRQVSGAISTTSGDNYRPDALSSGPNSMPGVLSSGQSNNDRPDISGPEARAASAGRSVGSGSYHSGVTSPVPGAMQRQDFASSGSQPNNRFDNSLPGQQGAYQQSHQMGVDPRVSNNTQQSLPMPGNVHQQSHQMNVDPRVSNQTKQGLPLPSNTSRPDVPRQPGTHSHNSSIAPTIFNTPNTKQRTDGPRPSLPPLKPVFGVSLDDLFRRDSSAVPMIVYQCVQAVDLFGLDVEGIYRTSGSAPHIMEMRSMFDNDSSQVDFRNPAAFHHDIASVTTLLKHFLRDLPDPLLTSANYISFINSAKIEDDIIRRDSLHSIINSLPDPNYATLRVITLHLHRVAEHSPQNRMTPTNLGICFGPTLMGQQVHGGGPGGGVDIKDAAWQARVVETLLNNTFQIFDDDD